MLMMKLLISQLLNIHRLCFRRVLPPDILFEMKHFLFMSFRCFRSPRAERGLQLHGPNVKVCGSVRRHAVSADVFFVLSDEDDEGDLFIGRSVHALSLFCARGVTDVDYGLYPSQELQRDWLTAYLESYKHGSGREVTVTEAEVTRLYHHVCKFSLVSVTCRKAARLFPLFELRISPNHELSVRFNNIHVCRPLK